MPRFNPISPLPTFTETSVAHDTAPVRETSSPIVTSTKPPRGTIRDRFEQMIDMRKVPQPPALRVDGWNEQTAMQICEGWRDSLVEKVSVPELSHLLALNFERAHADEIPPERRAERLLPEGAGKADYYAAMVETFLKAIGADDEEMGKILDSFKRAGLGALHRQPVLASSTANGILGAVQIGASLHPPAKVALSTVQLVLTAVSSALAVFSSKLRFRNSGTEEVMPYGKADAPPSGKIGPSVAGASWKLLTQLGKISADVKEMEAALAELERAQAEWSSKPEGSAAWHLAERKLRAAGDDLSVAFAAFCFRSEFKAQYKAASESAKVEYRGNELNLGLGYVNGAASLTATLMAIFAPTAPATFGMSVAAVAVGALAYVGYQLSTGPSKDGEAKATRAIVALAKSADLMGGKASKQQTARAEAYRIYLGERRSRDPAVKSGARGKLLDTLGQIAADDSTNDELRPLDNWTAYADYRARRNDKLTEIEGDHARLLGLVRAGIAARQPPSAQTAASGNATATAVPGAPSRELELVTEVLEADRAQRSEAALQALDAQFAQTHEAKFNTGTVTSAWKTPYRMRFDSMGRLLLGKVVASTRALLKHKTGTVPESGPQAQFHTTRLAGKRQILKASLRDWVNFETAQARLKEAAKLPAGDTAAVREKLASAARALAAIGDADAQALFMGDGRAQVEATRLAKRLTAGEEERYTMTMGGAAAVAATANTFGAAFSLGVNVKKDILAGHGHPWQTHYGDQKDGQVITQGSTPITAHYSAGERARFQKTEMARLLAILKRKGEPLKLALDVPEAETYSPSDQQLDFKALDASLDSLVNELETRADIADELTLSVGGRKITAGRLDGTTDYYTWRREQASRRTRAAFRLGQARVVGKAAWLSLASPVAQALAHIPLSRTGKAARRGSQKSVEVRDALAALAGDARMSSIASQRSEPAGHTRPGDHGDRDSDRDHLDEDRDSFYELDLGPAIESDRFEIDIGQADARIGRSGRR
ncbi:hypothetical protein [Trinickia soli]|uniref:Type III effector protein n=1 Tax=Trinickia soli TaxID=380675 RepID=A0A2N7W4T0_9BURK|nr:hypothetical protein [Trinickia soli]PMS24411.1 hypothetical protein C0Z19_14195 [Trinickia soli]CAB3676460.1 hypothetical protein LMG24076_02197 [Trinickia soli]